MPIAKMNKTTVRKLIVIGAGLHFRERHFKVLDEIKSSHEISIELVIDLKCEQQKILAYFANKSLKPNSYLFLPESNRNNISIEDLDYLVGSKIKIQDVDGVIICTEPKVHKLYTLWSIKNNLDIFCDKPLSAFSSHKIMHLLYSDYLEIAQRIKTKNVNFVLCCERRGHFGYEFIMNYIADMIKQFRVPITFIDIHHGGGLWHMPDEYFKRENHPYKYGYGIILHSGYHYIDLLINLIKLNNSVVNLSVNECELHVLATTPYNSFNIINNETYASLVNTDRFAQYFSTESIEKMKYFGETNTIISGRFKNGDQVVTNFSLKLIELSVSTRNWHVLPENTYLENGRMHQENIIIHLGPLCSIHIRINPYKAMSSMDYDIEDFTVDIMNNSKIVGKEAIISINRSDISKLYPNLLPSDSLNIKSRRWQLIEFLHGRQANSGIESHKDSIKFLDRIYCEIQNQSMITMTKGAEKLPHEYS